MPEVAQPKQGLDQFLADQRMRPRIPDPWANSATLGNVTMSNTVAANYLSASGIARQ